jgi:hypothetical protein
MHCARALGSRFAQMPHLLPVPESIETDRKPLAHLLARKNEKRFLQ